MKSSSRFKQGRFIKIKRLREIISLFNKYGVTKYFLTLPFSGSKELEPAPDSDSPVHVRVRRLFEELGPTFIKLGQFLSTQYDLVPKEFCEEFRKLQDRVPPFPHVIAKVTIESEMRKGLAEVFSEFDETPVASASLSQVYKARLHSGEVVAVKVQRPFIEEKMNVDFDILLYLSRFFKMGSRLLRKMNITSMIKEAKSEIMKELDYKDEIKNIERLYNNLKRDSYVKIPKPYKELSTANVLVMEFVEGIKITDFDKIDALGLDKKILITNLIKTLHKQILRDGFFHGDPHPANVFVLKDGRIAFLDFGMVGEMDDKNKEGYIQQSIALSSGESMEFIKVYTGLNNFDMNKLDLETIEHEINKLTLDWFQQKIRSNGEFYYKVIMYMFSQGVKSPHQIVVLSKCLLTLSSLVRIYDVKNEESIKIFWETIAEEEGKHAEFTNASMMTLFSEFYNKGMRMFMSNLAMLKSAMHSMNEGRSMHSMTTANERQSNFKEDDFDLNEDEITEELNKKEADMNEEKIHREQGSL